MWNLFLMFSLLPPVPGLVSQGAPFTGQPTIPSVAGVKLSQPSISTVTTATQPMMPQQQVTPNQQQPVPPPGQPVPNQQPQAQPQQQPTPNQSAVSSAQPNMVSYYNQNKTSNTVYRWVFNFSSLVTYLFSYSPYGKYSNLVNSSAFWKIDIFAFVPRVRREDRYHW